MGMVVDNESGPMARGDSVTLESHAQIRQVHRISGQWLIPRPPGRARRRAADETKSYIVWHSLVSGRRTSDAIVVQTPIIDGGILPQPPCQHLNHFTDIEAAL